jgi:hypothetical protein
MSKTKPAIVTPQIRDAIGRVLADVHEERVRQLTKWGVQHRPDDTGGDTLRAEAEQAKRTCQFMQDHGPGGAGWRLVLAEEAAEAFAETDPAALRAELVQTAAVCVAWIEDLDSRDGAPAPAGPAGASPLVDEVRRLRAAGHALAELVGACSPPDIAGGYDACPCGRGSSWPCQQTRAVWAIRGIDADAEIAAVMERVRFEIWHAGGPYPDDAPEGVGQDDGATMRWVWPDPAPGEDTEMQEEFFQPVPDFPVACTRVHEHDPVDCAPEPPGRALQADDVTP